MQTEIFLTNFFSLSKSSYFYFQKYNSISPQLSAQYNLINGSFINIFRAVWCPFIVKCVFSFSCWLINFQLKTIIFFQFYSPLFLIAIWLIIWKQKSTLLSKFGSFGDRVAFVKRYLEFFTIAKRTNFVSVMQFDYFSIIILQPEFARKSVIFCANMFFILPNNILEISLLQLWKFLRILVLCMNFFILQQFCGLKYKLAIRNKFEILNTFHSDLFLFFF